MEENHHKKTSSREYIFSFPSTPSTADQDSDFEFGCLTPDSPSTDPNKNSPADHLFCNGRLLPHSFPVLQQQPTTMVFFDNIYRANSRASSVSSRDSLMSSRSNSSNSSRSSFSSARTSSSDNSERRRLYNFTSCQTPLASKVVIAQLYGSSQRWQHIMPVPAAALKRVDSRRKSCRVLVKEGQNNNKKQLKKGKRERSGFWRRFFRSFLVACRECHAMEPSTEDDILERNIKL